MVIDSSAMIAILCDEPERYDFNRKIEADSRRLISTASVLETSIVLETRYGEEAYRELDFFYSKQPSRSALLMPSNWRSPAVLIENTEKDGIRPVSTTETAFPMPWPNKRENFYCLKATTFLKLILSAAAEFASCF